MNGVIPDNDVANTGGARDFARAALRLVRGVRHNSSDDELLHQALELAADRLDTVTWAAHVRDRSDGTWTLAGHAGLSDADVATLASVANGPGPVGNAECWSAWNPIALDCAPWPGLSAEVDRACVLMPVIFIDGEVTAAVTAFAPASAELFEALDDVALLLWTARTRGRHHAILSARTGQYMALANHSPDVIWRLDNDHRIIYVNRAFEPGPHPAHLACVGCHVLEQVPEEVRAMWMSALAVVDAGSPHEFYYTFADRRFAVRLAPELTECDRVGGIVATIRDITRDFQLELDRAAAEIRCQVVSDVTRSVIYERRLNDEVAYVSQSIKAVFGYSAEEASRGGLAWWLDHVHPDDRARCARMFSGLTGCRDTQWAVEFRVKRADGSWATVIDHGRLLSATAHLPERTVGSVTDITAIRALQTQIHHSHRIELIGRLAGGVAHDFNNVLSAIGGFADLVLADTPANDPRTADLHEISALVRRATALTQNLLGLSRRRDQAKPVVLGVSDAIARLAPTLRTLLGSGVSLAIETMPAELNVRMDAGHFDQIVLNLAVNARDAMPDGGVVTIVASLECVHDGGESAGAVARIDVSDRGLGIPPEVIARIFQPYFTTKEEGHGTGLGLSVVHDIVEAAGGRIDVQSSPMEGTTFSVRLPLAVEPVDNAPGEPSVNQGAGAGTRVLFIEDEEPVRRATRRVLEREGFEVMEARTGDAGVATLLANRDDVDVILTDLYMPGLSGPALVERMRTDAPEIGCVVISGHAERFAALTQDSDRLAVLTKPCRPALLVGHLAEQARRTAERRRARRN